MAEALTPPKWIAKLRAEDQVRMDALEARIAKLERHVHVQSPSAVMTGGVIYE